MKAKLFAALGTGALILAASQAAMAHVSIGLNLGIPAPVFVAPAPVFVAPAPVMVAPAPVYVAAPPPMAVGFQPVMAPAIIVGWHGNRYWDGRRWWGRNEWRGHGRWR